MEEVRYDQALVRALLREQHPDLADLELTNVDGGWDNQVWRLGDQLGVRLPRTDRGPGLLMNEQRWLPQLADRLPLPVPSPVRIGQPSARFDPPWSVTRWVHGTPADRTPIAAVEASDVLAEFLNALHEPSPPDAPTSPDRGMPLSEVPYDIDAALAQVIGPKLAVAAQRVWQEAVMAPAWSGTPRWLHGDLHPANVVAEDSQLVGVIDFGDMCAGDPATDLSAAWLLLPDGAAAGFFNRYRGADEATIARAKGWAVLKAIGLIEVGRNGRLGRLGGKPTWEPAGYATLNRVVATS